MKHFRWLVLLLSCAMAAPVLANPETGSEPPATAPAAPAAEATAPETVTATPPAAAPGDAADSQTIEQIIEVLAQAIREGNDPMRMRMWFRVREQGAQAVPALLLAFDKYPEMDVKEYMVKCLSWTKDEKAWNKVLGLMKSDDVVLRRRATYEINNFDDLRATQPLIEALKTDPDERVRIHACIALGVLDDKRAIAPLKDSYKSDASDLVKQFAKKQLELYEINYPEAHVE